MVNFETICLACLESIKKYLDLNMSNMINHSSFRDRCRFIYNDDRLERIVEHFLYHIIKNDKADKPYNFSNISLLEVIIARAFEKGLKECELYNLCIFEDVFLRRFNYEMKLRLVPYLQFKFEKEENGK